MIANKDQDLLKSIVMRWYDDILSQGRLDVADEILTPDASTMGADIEVKGLENMKSIFKGMRNNLPDLKMTVERITCEENKVAVCWTDRGTHSGGPLRGFLPTGRKIENHGMSIFHLENNRIKEVRFCDDVYGTLLQTTPLLADYPDLWMPPGNIIAESNIQGDVRNGDIDINKCIVKKLRDLIMNSKDLKALPDLISQSCNVRMWFTGYFPTSGINSFSHWIGKIQNAVPDIKFDFEDTVAEGDTIVVHWKGQGAFTEKYSQFPPTNMPIAVEGVFWIRTDGEKIIEITISLDRMAMFTKMKTLPMINDGNQKTKTNKHNMHILFDGIWNKEDYSLIDKYIGESMIQHIPGEGAGREGLRETVRKYHAGFSDMDLAIEEEIAENDFVVHRWSWRCTHTGLFNGIPPTGKRVNFTGMTIARLENGQMVEHWSNVDAVGLLIQLGVIATPGN